MSNKITRDSAERRQRMPRTSQNDGRGCPGPPGTQRVDRSMPEVPGPRDPGYMPGNAVPKGPGPKRSSLAVPRPRPQEPGYIYPAPSLLGVACVGLF